ncbi:MAG: type II toxin-antitoxin system RelE/ParE family toxin [Candidatus Omnitrophota bacterium]
MKIRWTQRGIDSLESIVDYIAADSEYYAGRLAEGILHSLEILKNYPQLGRVVPEFNQPSIRELIYHNYRIVYKIEQQTIIVLLVSHGMQILPNIPYNEN